jgi:hypothetical protein
LCDREVVSEALLETEGDEDADKDAADAVALRDGTLTVGKLDGEAIVLDAEGDVDWDAWEAVAEGLDETRDEADTATVSDTIAVPLPMADTVRLAASVADAQLFEEVAEAALERDAEGQKLIEAHADAEGVSRVEADDDPDATKDADSVSVFSEDFVLVCEAVNLAVKLDEEERLREGLDVADTEGDAVEVALSDCVLEFAGELVAVLEAVLEMEEVPDTVLLRVDELKAVVEWVAELACVLVGTALNENDPVEDLVTLGDDDADVENDIVADPEALPVDVGVTDINAESVRVPETE